jgi:thiol-disulfide isomerase/thioredoxin/DNA-binding beta-propeller fold protein YncE
MAALRRAPWLSWALILLVIGMLGSSLLVSDSPSQLKALQKRADAPDFPQGAEWLNSRPLSKKDLKGKFVLVDFWTYCCINCMHILPELKKLEEKYPNELVVVGAHSAKFEEERQTENIREAILRYEIEHPVINDADHSLWTRYEVDTWPTIVLIDPDGKVLWRKEGEFKAEEVDVKLRPGVATHKRKGTLSLEPLKFELEAEKTEDTPLRFPGKLLADEKSDRLFIADSNHNRIVVTSLDGKLQATIGSGAIGRMDGDFATATFNHPQGLVLHGDTLYVADTENHLIRKVDLKQQKVVTIAGDGEQHPGAKAIWSRGKPKSIKLSSPWDLWIHDDDLLIAMAGPHQIWRMRLDESQIGPYAGNGNEDIIDGPILSDTPYRKGFASFAQPSGLTSDGTLLYVADSEGSSVRAVALTGRNKEVTTVVGTSHLPQARLFTFGDVDGPRPAVRLQHCLAVAYHSGVIYVADTYNNKIKAINAKTGLTQTFAGTGQPGLSDTPASFDEPGGLSIAGGKLYVADTNNHAIRVIELESARVSTLTIEGLSPPEKPALKKDDKRPDFSGAAEVKLKTTPVKPIDGKITLNVEIGLPEGWKTNPLGKPSYWIDSPSAKGALDRSAFGKRKLAAPASSWDIELPVSGKGNDTVRIATNYYYCQKADEGVCKVGAVVFTVPITVSEGAKESVVNLRYEADE